MAESEITPALQRAIDATWDYMLDACPTLKLMFDTMTPVERAQVRPGFSDEYTSAIRLYAVRAEQMAAIALDARRAEARGEKIDVSAYISQVKALMVDPMTPEVHD